MQADALFCGVPGAVVAASGLVAYADEQQVTLAGVDVLSRFGGEQVVGGDVVAGFEPGHVAGVRDVEQHASAHDVAVRRVDRELVDAVLPDFVCRDVVQRSLADDVA